MTGIRPKQLSRLGEFYLEESVLDVLLGAAQEGDCIGPAEISRRTGIFRDSGKGLGGNVSAMNDAIVTGLLIKLFAAGKVERCEQPSGKGGGWKLSAAELDRRRDDVDQA